MHSDEDKRRILNQLLPPQSRKIADIARDEGVSVTTIYLWRKELGYDTKQRIAKAASENDQRTQAEAYLTSEDKFLIVLETAELSAEELEQYACDNDLIASHILQWRDNCVRANELSETQLAIDRQELRRLQREVRALKRALAKCNPS